MHALRKHLLCSMCRSLDAPRFCISHATCPTNNHFALDAGPPGARCSHWRAWRTRWAGAGWRDPTHMALRCLCAAAAGMCWTWLARALHAVPAGPAAATCDTYMAQWQHGFGVRPTRNLETNAAGATAFIGRHRRCAGGASSVGTCAAQGRRGRSSRAQDRGGRAVRNQMDSTLWGAGRRGAVHQRVGRGRSGREG